MNIIHPSKKITNNLSLVNFNLIYTTLQKFEYTYLSLTGPMWRALTSVYAKGPPQRIMGFCICGKSKTEDAGKCSQAIRICTNAFKVLENLFLDSTFQDQQQKLLEFVMLYFGQGQLPYRIKKINIKSKNNRHL